MQKAILPAKWQPFEHPHTLVFAELSFFFASRGDRTRVATQKILYSRRESNPRLLHDNLAILPLHYRSAVDIEPSFCWIITHTACTHNATNGSPARGPAR